MLLENNPFPQDGRVRREARALVDAGYGVTVIAPASPGQCRTETVEGVRVRRYRVPPEGAGLLSYVVEYGYATIATFFLTLLVYVRSGFSVIHAHNPPDLFVLVAAWFKPLGVRFVFDHHDLSPEMYEARFSKRANPVVRRALLFFEGLTFRASDHVISTNESYAAIARERGGVSGDRITVVRNGPDLSRVRVLPEDPDLRSKAEFIFGYVGEMAPHDGVDHLIRALAHLAGGLGRDNFFCVLMGGGDEVPSLTALAADLGLKDRVWFTGQITDADLLMTYLSTTDICMTPDPSNSYTDRSTMVKMAEYMALGRPIVAFDLPEHRRTAGEAAAYAQPNDDRAFARTIEMLMDDPDLRAQMGKVGQDRVEKELAWSHQALRLVDAYASILGVSHPRVASDGGAT
jgi:glycosyltransferase involved in cell wall biosynthesis